MKRIKLNLDSLLLKRSIITLDSKFISDEFANKNIVIVGKTVFNVKKQFICYKVRQINDEGKVDITKEFSVFPREEIIPHIKKVFNKENKNKKCCKILRLNDIILFLVALVLDSILILEII